jgi:hypothetical protein
MIDEYVRRLGSLTESDWCAYAFAREPLYGKLKPEQRLEYFRGAAECGASVAESLKEREGELPVFEYAERENLNISLDSSPLDVIDMMFAKFIYPKDIIIYINNARMTDELIASNDLTPIAGNVKTEELLLAHELFHFYENRQPDLYIHRKHVLLFKIGRIENRSRIMCLSEIAAMSFAKVLTGLPCSPYLYDVMMLYANNPQRAKRQYEMILRVTGEE